MPIRENLLKSVYEGVYQKNRDILREPDSNRPSSGYEPDEIIRYSISHCVCGFVDAKTYLNQYRSR